jgi:hypothetical protein
MWWYGPEIRALLEDRTRDVRARAARSLRTVADTMERGGESDGRDHRFEQLDSTVRGGGRSSAAGGIVQP